MNYRLPFSAMVIPYRIVVTISEQNYVFEPDEEGQYRALGAPTGAMPDVDLLRAVAANYRAYNLSPLLSFFFWEVSCVKFSQSGSVAVCLMIMPFSSVK